MLSRDASARLRMDIRDVGKQLRAEMDELKSAIMKAAQTYPRATEGELVRAIQRELKHQRVLIPDGDIRKWVLRGRLEVQSRLL